MKILATILSLYLLVITCMPCCDLQECDNASESQFTTQQSHQAENEHANEICSPFCICACCTSVVELDQTDEYSFDRPEVTATFFQHTVAVVSNDFSAIWQPPKVG